MPTQIIACCFAFAAFAIAIVAGLAVSNPAMLTLKRAVGVLILAYPVGWMIGWIGHRAIREHLERYKQEHPIEPESAEDAAEDSAGSTHLSADATDEQTASAPAASNAA